MKSGMAVTPARPRCGKNMRLLRMPGHKMMGREKILHRYVIIADVHVCVNTCTLPCTGEALLFRQKQSSLPQDQTTTVGSANAMLHEC